MDKADFQTPGYEDMELSTQLIIAEALKRNLEVEVIDKNAQFIKLSSSNRSEYFKEATKTGADSYVISEILGDKFIAKKLLDSKKLRTPKGKRYSQKQSAIEDYPSYKKGKWVVKPTTTNYGIGITLLPKNTKKEDYEKAVDNAFQFDKTIIIEEFIPGIECRFLVIDGICRAVLNRVPANITGDGQHTIEALIDLKNKDPRRGKGYKTPLEFLQKGEAEKRTLNEQRLNFSSIPKSGEVIYIRHNSNISTGGDSIDFTEEVHESYKKIAEEATQAIGAKICGVDIIMNDYKNPANTNNHAIIEVNYNPVLYFHDFPYKGKKRHTATHILNLFNW